MNILYVSGYAAWDKVSKREMPSHHLFGIHEWIDHYENNGGKLRGVLKRELFNEEGYVDFYLWKSGKDNIISQVKTLVELGKRYDLVYDTLNRCSIYLGILKRIGLFKTKLVTIMHHPPYRLQLFVADSDIYIFFDQKYRNLATSYCSKKETLFYVNEWFPDNQWYNSVVVEKEKSEVFFIDNGKSKRDRNTLFEATDLARIECDYAGGTDAEERIYAKPYVVDLNDDIYMANRLKKYRGVIVPILENKKNKVGPLGITSFLDCVALQIPVIASDNVCFADIVDEKQLGILYKTGDPQSLARAMEVLRFNQEFYDKCKENLYEYSINHSMFDYSETLKGIFQNLNG